MQLDVFFLVAVFALGGLGAWLWTNQRARRQRRDSLELKAAVAEGRNVPFSLHPVIDPDRCIGSLSCLKVCPEGDILGIVNGRAELLNPMACIGHGKCELECPVDAIKLVFGTAQRGVELPSVDEFFETNRAGIHIVGELGGMGLIKNAITQGLQVASRIKDTIAEVASSNAEVDVAIVGAGPAGLATALGLKEAGVSFRILDQESVGGTIANYPRQKVVMTEKVNLPFLGKFGKTLISKEELLAQWQKAITKAGVKVESGTKVLGVSGDDGSFSVQTNKGPVSARKVVLAIGRRGTPRKLKVPGEELSKVAYRLIDPEQYEGSRVLVCGGGDAGMEAALQLADSTEAEVSLMVNDPDFTRGREANKKRCREYIAAGKIKGYFATSVGEIRPDSVVLLVGPEKKPTKIKNDFVIVNIGGELPDAFLKAMGITMQRLFGKGLGEQPTLTSNVIPVPKKKKGSAKALEQKKKQRLLALWLTLAGVLITALMIFVGQEYYLLGRRDRLDHPLHALLKPSGPWGHGVGIIATLFMMSNFIYSLRKRWRMMKGAGPIGRWLTFHQFVGLMSPVAIAFHAAFQSNNLIATATAVSVAVVVATGIVGRFIFGWIPSEEGRQSELAEVLARWERLKSRIRELRAGTTDEMQVSLFLDQVSSPVPADVGLVAFLLRSGREKRTQRRDVKRLRALFPDKVQFKEFSEGVERLRILRAQVGFYRSLKNLMRGWRVFHVILAILLVVMIAAHIGVSLYLGYFWIFR